MTLVKCKSKIRVSKKPGDWIAGFTSVDINGDQIGNNPLELPDHLRPDVPPGQSSLGDLTHDFNRANRFIEFIESNYKKGIQSKPSG